MNFDRIPPRVQTLLDAHFKGWDSYPGNYVMVWRQDDPCIFHAPPAQLPPEDRLGPTAVRFAKSGNGDTATFSPFSATDEERLGG